MTSNSSFPFELSAQQKAVLVCWFSYGYPDVSIQHYTALSVHDQQVCQVAMDLLLRRYGGKKPDAVLVDLIEAAVSTQLLFDLLEEQPEITVTHPWLYQVFLHLLFRPWVIAYATEQTERRRLPPDPRPILQRVQELMHEIDRIQCRSSRFHAHLCTVWDYSGCSVPHTVEREGEWLDTLDKLRYPKENWGSLGPTLHALRYDPCIPETLLCSDYFAWLDAPCTKALLKLCPKEIR